MRNKYNNQKTIYNGFKYDSKKEAEHAKLLDLMQRAKDPAQRVISIKRQVPYVININGVKICTYYADFLVQYGNGKREVQDVKGYKTDVYKLKKKLVEAIYKVKIIEI